jgi:hypothetical protein
MLTVHHAFMLPNQKIAITSKKRCERR